MIHHSADRKRLFFLAALLALLGFGCMGIAMSNPGKLVTETYSVGPGEATSVRVTLLMDLGELKVTGGGGTKLVDGTFDYNFTELKPRFQYTVEGSAGTLVIDQPEKKPVINYRDPKNQWNLRLGGGVPVALEINTGAGTSELDLTGVDLSQLTLKFGAGTGQIDLSSGWKHDVSATITGGVGEITLTLPRDMAAQVTVKKGVGSVNAQDLDRNGDVYTNQAFASGGPRLSVSIEPGVGSVNLKVK